jgi:hypothetical protein
MQSLEPYDNPYWGFEQLYWLNLVILPVESVYIAG